MKKVTIRVPATTANLGPGFDAFGCALSLYTDVTFEEMESGLEITGCDEAYAGPDNMAYTAYCAVLESLSEEIRGVKIHIDAQIPICRGLGSSAALLVAGAIGANCYRPLTRTPEEALEVMLEIENACGLKFTDIVNNSNLASETTPETILASKDYMEKLSQLSGLPIWLTTAEKEVAAQLNMENVLPLTLQEKYFDLPTQKPGNRPLWG